MGIFDSFKKGSKLNAISKILGEGSSKADIQNMIKNAGNIESILSDIGDDAGREKRRIERERKEKALEDLFDLVENSEDLNSVMKRYSANRDTLKRLYERLKSEGAGQWHKGHYVVASVFAFKQTLDYCLKSDASGLRFGSVAGRCLMYFKNNEKGTIE